MNGTRRGKGKTFRNVCFMVYNTACVARHVTIPKEWALGFSQSSIPTFKMSRQTGQADHGMTQSPDEASANINGFQKTRGSSDVAPSVELMVPAGLTMVRHIGHVRSLRTQRYNRHLYTAMLIHCIPEAQSLHHLHP